MEKKVKSVVFPLLAACLFFLAQKPAPVQAAKPNIVLLIADDCTRFDLGCYGSRDSKTPAIDRLATQGVRFTSCFQSAPTCSPTRHNLYTGMFPTRTGAYPNHTFANDTVKSVVQRLKPLGYRVALAGKRHILPESIFAFEYLDAGGDAAPNFANIDTFVSSAVSSRQPFCLFICSHLPHSPWNKGDPSKFNANTLTLPPHYYDNAATRTNYRNYLAEINALDSQVQKSLDVIDKYNIADSTAFFFTSEQGTSQPFAKWTCYNAGLGTALMVRWPGVVSANSTSDALIEYSDMVPTFIDIAGGAPVAGLDGSSIVPVLRGQATKHKSFSYGQETTRGIYGGAEYYPIRSVCDGAYRLIVNYAPDVSFECLSELPGWEAAAATDPIAAKLVARYHFRPAMELYDDIRDPWNMVNLIDSAKYDSVQAVLQGRLTEWLNYTNDDIFQTELSAFDRMPDKVPHNGDSVVVIQTLSPFRTVRNTVSGVHYALYNGNWTTMPNFSTLTPAQTGTVANFRGPASLPGRTGNRYAVLYSGYVHTAVKGYYTFYLNSFNYARLSIDNKFIAGTTVNQTATVPARRYGCILVDTGRHAIEVSFLGNSVNDSLSVAWSYPGLIEAVGDLLIPNNQLVYGDLVTAAGPQAVPAVQGKTWTIRGNTLTMPAGLNGSEVRIFNTQGSLVNRYRNVCRIDLSHLTAGIYVVKAWSGGICVASARVLKK